MSENNSIKPVRVMHLVSSEGVAGATQQALFMPMLTRMPKARVRSLVVAMAPDVVPGPVLRQNGVPVYDVALSQRKFSIGAFGQLTKATRTFRPDVIQAWGHTALIVSHWLRERCEWEAKLVWSIANTAPLPRNPGMIDRQKLKYAARLAKRADRIVYTSEAAASTHRRVGFPEEGHLVVPLGLDPTRFKPDMAARRKVREQLGIGGDAFVIGMIAPFQPEYDHATLLKAVGELIKTNPNLNVLLAGHGVQKGNAPLMALVGGGTLGTRTHLLGEWSDVSAFFNACDVACSSALNDNARMSLVTAMLCGVPCVATGMGAQGEVIGHHGVAVEPGSPAAFIRGITRILQMTPEKRLALAQGARKHALANFVSVRSLQKYLQLYYDLLGRTLDSSSSVPAPKVDAAIPAPLPAEREVPQPAAKPKATVEMYELSDPDSLESRGPQPASAPAAAAPPTQSPAPAPKADDGDVLEMFEISLAQQSTPIRSPMTERARGFVEQEEDLLAPELLQAEVAKSDSPPAAPAPVEAAKPAVAPKAEKAVTAPKIHEPATAPKVENPATAPKAQSPEKNVALAPADQPRIIAAAPNAGNDLSAAETTLDLANLKLEATTTLEIPADLIFVPADAGATAANTSSNVSPSTPSPKAESQPAVEPKPLPPASVTRAADSGSAPAVPAASTGAADSATVPELAVDALLSIATDAAPVDGGASPAAEESLQLDLLGDAPPDRKIAG